MLMQEPTFPNALHQRLRANAAVSGQVEDLRERVRVIEPKVRDAAGTLKEAEDRLGEVEPIAAAAHDKIKDATGTLKHAEGRLGEVEPIAAAAHEKVKDAASTLKDAEDRLGEVEPIATAAHERVKDAAGTLKDAEHRLGEVEPIAAAAHDKVKDAVHTLKDAEGRLDTIDPKVLDASEDVTLGSLESDRTRLIAYNLLHDLIDQWGQILCAPVQEMHLDRVELLNTAAPLKDAFELFVEQHDIDVHPHITEANDRLIREGTWKESLQSVFQTVSELRVRAEEFLVGQSLAPPPPAVVAQGKPTRSRGKAAT